MTVLGQKEQQSQFLLVLPISNLLAKIRPVFSFGKQTSFVF